jgi:phosphatidylserine/phosphatidylglycerophosphate/cardiolipin synthase-like enzyme
VNEVPAIIVAVVEDLGDAHIRALAAAYRCAHTYTAANAAAVRSAIPDGHRDQADRINVAWATTPNTEGPSIALALETALAARHLAAAETIEVVITGPDSPAAPVRLTFQVVQQLIASARQRVTIVSYAAYQIPSIIGALDDAATRGVRIDLILESPEYLDGGGGAEAYARYRTFEWPSHRRDPPDAKLHAKAVIVDSRDVLLTSANLTNAAYDKNIELGVLCRGGTIAQRVQKHFDSLIAAGVLNRVQPNSHVNDC